MEEDRSDRSHDLLVGAMRTKEVAVCVEVLTARNEHS